MLTIIEQLRGLMKRSQHILVVTKKNPTIDDVAATIALRRFFEQNKKTVEIVSAGFRATSKMRFLSGIKDIRDHLSRVRKFIIKVDTSRTKVEEFSYDLQDSTMSIYLLPSSGMFRKEDVSTAEGDYRFDMIVSVGAPDFESLGEAYAKNSELFYEAPLVNIDHKPTNEQFGQINVVDFSSSSCSEIVYQITKELGTPSFDSDTATAILAGMIAETKSFQKRISPKSLEIASHLISQGARRDEIIHHLYFTKPIELLRLWGKVLARLAKDETYGMVWSMLSPSDFEGNTFKDGLEDVMDELISASPEAHVIVLFAETTHGKTEVFVQTVKTIDATLLAKPFVSSSDRQFATWTTAQPLDQTRADVLASFRQILARIPR